MIARFKYNLLILFGRLLFCFGWGFIIISVLILLIFTNSRSSREGIEWIPVILAFVIGSFITIGFIRSILNETYSLDVGKDYLRIYRPIFDDGTIIQLSEIRGFSTCNVRYGIAWGSSVFMSKSIIVYTTEFAPMELISYNYFGFIKIEKKLKDLDIQYFGFERHKSKGLFGREYKFQLK